MATEPSDALLGAVVLILAIASVGTWFALADRLRHGPILPFEPRRPVPWHGAWLLLPVLLVAFTIYAALAGDNPAADAKSATATDLVERIALGSVQQSAFVVAFLAVMIAVSRATRSDLGIPRDFGELARDVRIGFVAWLAALAPVYGVQFVLISVLGGAQGHPLIKMVEEHASPTLFVLAFAAAVVVAPICEELLFRMLLQGWLEKWEDKWLGWPVPSGAAEEGPGDLIPDDVTADGIAASDGVPSPLQEDELREPPRIGVGGFAPWLAANRRQLTAIRAGPRRLRS